MESPERQIVQLAQALAHLGIADVRCRVSVRVDDRVVTTPRPGGGAPPPGSLAIEDLVAVDFDGAKASGRWAAPQDIALDLAIYRARPEARSVVHAQPRKALSFAAADRPLLPLTHTEAALAYPSLPYYGDGRLIDTPSAADQLITSLSDHAVAVLTGHGSIAIGRSPAEAAMFTQQVELLAQINALAVGFTGRAQPKTVELVDSDRITAQKAPPDDFMSYFRQVAEHRPKPTDVPDPGDSSEDGLRRRITVACRLLQHHGLIEHLEHVSVRIGDGDQFLITPRAHFAHMQPEQIATVDMQGRWVAGPMEPPPFLWFHRDLFAARPDVKAIVHTHQPYARALAMADVVLRPLYRAGASELSQPAMIYDVPDLMFDASHRAAAIDLLGSASILHERSHGVDFLAETVEAATVTALHYEDQARMLHLAGRLGTPRPLDEEVVALAAAEEPGPFDWWRHYLVELPA